MIGETLCKSTYNEYRLTALIARDHMMASWPLVHLRPSIGGLGGGDKVEGKWQGALEAAPSNLKPYSSYPHSGKFRGRANCQ